MEHPDQHRDEWRGLEFKAVRLELKDVDEKGHFEGFAAVYGNVDRVKDIIEDGAFEKTVRENGVVPILHMHNPFEPIGVATLRHVTSGPKKGLGFEGKLALDVQRAREDHSLMRLGAMARMSIGYKVHKRAWEGRTRRILELAVKEVSPVTTGFEANPQATIDSVKAALAGLDDAADLAEALEEAKAGRVLSESNIQKIRAAIVLLEALLSGKATAEEPHTPEEPEDSTLRDAIESAKTSALMRDLAEAIRKA